jgi:tetratricopeptide (TPR) repeat protein
MSERPMHAIPGAFQQLQQLYAEGEAALDAGDFRGAVAKFSEGLAIDDHFRQRYVTMYAQRAFALQRMGQNEQAIPDYTKAIEMEPPMNQAQYYFHRGMCWAALPNGSDNAIADYTASIALHRDHPGPFHLRGKLLLDAGRWADAEADFARLLELRPNPDGYANRAYARLRQGRPAEALADAESSQRMQDDPSTHYLLASIHAAQGNADATFAAMRQALHAYPDYAQHFAGDPDFARYHQDPRFAALVRS